MSLEFRVCWQREGYDKRRKIFGSRAGAERWVLRLHGELPIPADEDPDAYACCPGYECGCGGVTNAEAREQQRERFSRVPPLIFGPVLQERPVGAWNTLSAAQPAPYPKAPELVSVATTADDLEEMFPF